MPSRKYLIIITDKKKPIFPYKTIATINFTLYLYNTHAPPSTATQHNATNSRLSNSIFDTVISIIYNEMSKY